MSINRYPKIRFREISAWPCFTAAYQNMKTYFLFPVQSPKKACMCMVWLLEGFFCSCLNVLPGPAWLLLNISARLFSGPAQKFTKGLVCFAEQRTFKV